MRTAAGGWQGTGHESHLELRPEENALVEAAHQRAAQSQGGLDTMMREVESGTSSYGAELRGEEHSLKTLDSFQSKVARSVHEDPSRERMDVVADRAATTNDLNRYTVTFPTDRYAAGVGASYQQLEDRGYREIPGSHKNTWDQPDYKGLNTSWQHHETGQRVEVQFHTPESFRAKEDNHLVYELDRSGSLSDDERDAAVHVQAQRYRNVPVPPDHEQFGTRRPPKEMPETSADNIQRVRDKEQAALDDARVASAMDAGESTGEQGYDSPGLETGSTADIGRD